ncbi:hypothetical protein GCM10027341_09650 [Spirosoma knui]
MYDTAHLFLPTEQAGGIDLPAYVPKLLDRVSEHYHDNGSASVSGHLSNLRVSAGGAGLWVKGSLCTYYYQNNFGSLTRQDTYRTIEQLSDALCLPMSRANVGRIDVGKTMLVKHPPAAYFAELGLCQYYARLSQPKSIRYQNGKRVLTFYDKKAEGKQHGAVLPAIWINRNALRYEARFMSRLPQQFNQAEVLAANLHEERFYMGVIDRWVKEFGAIQKVNQVDVNLKQSMRSIKDFSHIAERLLVQCLGGETAALELIEQNRL